MTRGSAEQLVLLHVCLLLLCCAWGQMGTSSSEVCKSCHANATCMENENRYYCICNFGLIGNGRSHCLDKDECQIGANKICGDHTACHNTYGSFYCVCLKGYRPSNNNDTFIPNDGTYCTDIDECAVPDTCGYHGECKNVVGSYECYCKEGYRLRNGTEPFQAEGDMSLCTAIDCGLPPALPHSHVDPTSNTMFGSQVIYSCDPGFIAETGKNKSICTSSGKWEEATLQCKVIDCGPPMSLPNTVIQSLSNTTFGSNVTYSCSEGFVSNIGHETSICTEEGRWEGASLMCKAVDCGQPLALPNTVIQSLSNTTVGNKVTYRCENGFVADSGHNTSICTGDGKWKGATFMCKVMDCGSPPSILHASTEVHGNTSYGSVLVYDCLHGYVIESGHEVATCNEEGQWEGVDLVCREIDCGQPPSVSNAEMIWSGTRNLGSEVHYKCVKGFYNPDNYTVSRCTSNETWENVTFTCTEVDCGAPSIIDHADLLWNNQSSLGSVAHYMCKPGFKASIGINVSVCSAEGAWNKLNLTCTVKEDLIGSVVLVNDTCLQWRKSTDILDWTIFYNLSLIGTRWYDKDFSHELNFNFTTDNVYPTTCLDLRPGTKYTGTISAFSTELPEIQINVTVETTMKEGFSDLRVTNGSCLQWTRNFEKAGTWDVYTLFIQGMAQNPEEFLPNIMFNISTDKESPVLCLDLPPAAEYIINVTEASTGLSANVQLNVPVAETKNISDNSLLNEACLRWNRSIGTDGLLEIYKLRVQVGKQYPKELLQELLFNISIDDDMPVVCLDLPMDAANVTEPPSHLTAHSPFPKVAHGEQIKNLTVINETCLHWRRGSTVKEVYKIVIQGIRWFQKNLTTREFNFSTSEEFPVVCLDLHPGTNYTVRLLSTSPQQSWATINIVTRIADPPLPKVIFIATQGQLPRVSFHSTEGKHGPISSYQVFVIHLYSLCTFTCETLEAVSYFSNVSKAVGYITAEFLPSDISDQLEFSLGDRQYYGDFYNAPLARKDYCIILRIVSNWNKMKSQSCMVLAEIKDSSPQQHHLTVVLLGAVAFVGFTVFISYSIARCCKRW
ncbi:sushi domain-containing protein 1 [Discoglossus pictus]